MEKKIISIFVCTLMIAVTALPVSETIKINEKKSSIIIDESYQLTTQSDLKTSGCERTVTVTVNPTDDTFVDNSQLGINFGDLDGLEVGDSILTPYTISVCRTLLKFDLTGSGIPAGAIITSATLNLLNEGIADDIEVGAHYLNFDSWLEMQTSWGVPPQIDLFDPIPTDIQTITQTNYWYSWDVTTSVQEAVDTDFVLSEVLKATVENTDQEWCLFLSKEYGGYDPYIVIDYCSLGDVTIVIPPGFYLGADFPVILENNGPNLLNGVNWQIDWTTIFSFPPNYPPGFSADVTNIPPGSVTVNSGPLPPAGFFGIALLNILVTADCATDVTTNAILLYFVTLSIIRVF